MIFLVHYATQTGEKPSYYSWTGSTFHTCNHDHNEHENPIVLPIFLIWQWDMYTNYRDIQEP